MRSQARRARLEVRKVLLRLRDLLPHFRVILHRNYDLLARLSKLLLAEPHIHFRKLLQAAQLTPMSAAGGSPSIAARSLAWPSVILQAAAGRAEVEAGVCAHNLG